MKKQMLFGQNIDPYFDEMMEDLGKLIAIPSVCEAPTGIPPFGKPCQEALDYILSVADRLGLATKNVDYYAGEASYGEGDTCIDVLTHVDVVPVSDGWETDPYTMVRKGNLIYGRGMADDKGPAIAALYALKALKDASVKGRCRLRVIFGCGEEIGSDDLDIYYRQQGFPAMGFTPDCTYGICNSEKGILRIDFTAARTKNSVIQKFHAGAAVNSVPDKAYAEILCTDEQYERIRHILGHTSDFNLKREGHLAFIQAAGKAAHGAEPELGENAASRLIHLMQQIFTTQELGPIFTFAAEKIGMQYNGSSLGIRRKDAQSGVLTLNLGVVSVDGKEEKLSVDIRYPVTVKKEDILSQLRLAAKPYDIRIDVVNHMAPLHVPSDSLLVSTLLKAFEAVTNEKCDIYSTGGGTYARHANNTVAAFGPIFAEEPSRNVHGPNEYIDVDYYRQHCRICLEAMYRLFTE